MQRLAGWIARGMKVAREALTQVGHDVQDLRAVDGLLKPSDEATGEEREGQCVSLWQEWEASVDPMHQPCAKVMSRCEPGVFVGGEGADFPADHWDVERWFTGPTGHERRMHGRRHAGVRLVQQGPTLLWALDAQVHHHGPCTGDDLEPSRQSRVPAGQQEALERGKIMRQARSRKKRPLVLADLEKRYVNAP